MKTWTSPGFLLLSATVIAVGSLACVAQWRETVLLRAELELARMDASELAGLRAQNQKLRAARIPASELEHLRADRAALPRLRAELEALDKTAPPGAH
jgi:hypothetical protein